MEFAEIYTDMYFWTTQIFFKNFLLESDITEFRTRVRKIVAGSTREGDLLDPLPLTDEMNEILISMLDPVSAARPTADFLFKHARLKQDFTVSKRKEQAKWCLI